MLPFPVSPAVFMIAFLFGTGAIALWIDARFPALAPADLARAMARAMIAVAAGWLLFPSMWDAVSSARARGATWEQIASALGVTRQAAFLRHRDARTPRG